VSQADKVSQIAKYNDRSSPLSRHHSKTELGDLREVWRNKDRLDHVLWDLFPIKIVTILEVFFRAWIKELVDHGTPFVKNAADLAKDTALKFDYAISQALVGRTVSLGDLIAHSVSINGIEQLAGNLTKLLGEDYFRSIALVHDRLAVEIKGEPAKPIIGDLAVLRKRIAKLYVIRNIIAHEAPTQKQYTELDVDDFFDAATELVQATHERFSFLLLGAYPLTQLDINMLAAEALKEAEGELGSTLQLVPHSPEFQRVQDAWQNYAELQARFRSGIDQPGRGSISPMLYSRFKADLIGHRVKELSPRPEGEW
jgi:hypothetical protein